MRFSLRVLIAVLTAAAGVVFMTTLVRTTLYAPDTEVASSTLAALAPAREATPGELPARVRIPSLGIDAKVKHVGVNDKGNMATPGNFQDTGWYKYGTVPGFMGSAVIDGHVDNALALDGVFKNLKDLKPGDSVFIDTASSTPLHFVVERAVSYPTPEIPLEEVFTAKDTARLNLITCTGEWNKDKKEYDSRLVVYAVLAP
jgi:sortase A